MNTSKRRRYSNSDSAIAGLGMTKMGRIYGSSPIDFAVQAVAEAIDDCGIDKSDIDGLLISGGLCTYRGKATV